MSSSLICWAHGSWVNCPPLVRHCTHTHIPTHIPTHIHSNNQVTVSFRIGHVPDLQMSVYLFPGTLAITIHNLLHNAGARVQNYSFIYLTIIWSTNADADARAKPWQSGSDRKATPGICHSWHINVNNTQRRRRRHVARTRPDAQTWSSHSLVRYCHRA